MSRAARPPTDPSPRSKASQQDDTSIHAKQVSALPSRPAGDPMDYPIKTDLHVWKSFGELLTSLDRDMFYSISAVHEKDERSLWNELGKLYPLVDVNKMHEFMSDAIKRNVFRDHSIVHVTDKTYQKKRWVLIKSSKDLVVTSNPDRQAEEFQAGCPGPVGYIDSRTPQKRKVPPPLESAPQEKMLKTSVDGGASGDPSAHVPKGPIHNSGMLGQGSIDSISVPGNTTRGASASSVLAGVNSTAADTPTTSAMDHAHQHYMTPAGTSGLDVLAAATAELFGSAARSVPTETPGLAGATRTVEETQTITRPVAETADTVKLPATATKEIQPPPAVKEVQTPTASSITRKRQRPPALKESQTPKRVATVKEKRCKVPPATKQKESATVPIGTKAADPLMGKKGAAPTKKRKKSAAFPAETEAVDLSMPPATSEDLKKPFSLLARAPWLKTRKRTNVAPPTKEMLEAAAAAFGKSLPELTKASAKWDKPPAKAPTKEVKARPIMCAGLSRDSIERNNFMAIKDKTLKGFPFVIAEAVRRRCDVIGRNEPWPYAPTVDGVLSDQTNSKDIWTVTLRPCKDNNGRLIHEVHTTDCCGFASSKHSTGLSEQCQTRAYAFFRRCRRALDFQETPLKPTTPIELIVRHPTLVRQRLEDQAKTMRRLTRNREKREGCSKADDTVGVAEIDCNLLLEKHRLEMGRLGEKPQKPADDISAIDFNLLLEKHKREMALKKEQDSTIADTSSPTSCKTKS